MTKENCKGSTQQWVQGPEGGQFADGRPRKPGGRPECPVCHKSWRQLGRFNAPQVGSPHHTVPVH